MFKTLKKQTISSVDSLSFFGSIEFFLITILFLGLIGNLPAALFLLGGFLVIEVIIITIRIHFFRKRPKPEKYTNLVEKIKAGSMPSSHAALIAFLLQSMIFSFSQQFYLTLFFIILTILVLYSRVHLGKHYTSDVVVGFLIGLGVFVAMTFWQLLLV